MAGIYIHIPFCKKACNYCDFHFTTSFKQVDKLTDAICKEIVLKKDRIAGHIESIYFGGGTPSVLSTENLGKIFETLYRCFQLSSTAEITLEANPDDLTVAKIADLRQLPINRFSIGIQSFFNDDLLWMNRAHNANEAESCIKRAQDAGFENLSIDLIFGYPQLSNEKLLTNIHQATTFSVPHISAYSLTVENKTVLAHAIEKGKQKALSDEQSATQFMIMSESLLNKGYQHYEISNYGLPGKHAVHNTNYWKGIPYLGIGPSAHGFDGINRQVNIAHNTKYLEAIHQNRIPETLEQLSFADRFNENIMISLRTMWGIDLDKVASNFGPSYAAELKEQILPFIKKEQLQLSANKITLTQQGKLFADGIAASLFIENE